jgi:aspartyl-tRNA(Asn)/glutamyl-tRNA(Gln) amidotransferase subunit A
VSLPNPSSLAANSPVRAGFHAALEQIESFPVERNWRPAFLTPLSTLPQPRRAPLPDLPGKRPPVTPFGGQPLTIAGALDALRKGSLTVSALVEQMLAAIDLRQPSLNAFVYVTPPAELQAQVHELDVELRAGVCRGTLHGIPIAVKDLFDVAGMPNTASSPVLDDYVSGADAGSVRLLKLAGAVITGKTHTHEFSLGATTPQSRNPWDTTRDPGGSSGGSAIAVATGMSLGALATDTRASLRVPAALCGIVGYKPTYGLVPSDGLIMLSWSLDHVGHMAATVEDAALLLDVLDPAPHMRYSDGLHKSMRNVRIGVPLAALENAEAGVAAAFREAMLAMQRTGAEVIEIETPGAGDFDLAVGMGLIVSRAEAAAYHTIYGDRRQRYATTAVAEQMDEAVRVSAVHYLQAQRAREDLRWRMLRPFDRFDALLMPTTRIAAPKSDEADRNFLVLSQNCILWSFVGFPVITLPCGRTPLGLPAGAQLVGAPYEDARLLSIAAALELELNGSA